MEALWPHDLMFALPCCNAALYIGLVAGAVASDGYCAFALFRNQFPLGGDMFHGSSWLHRPKMTNPLFGGKLE